jgi:hypothetical protein
MYIDYHAASNFYVSPSQIQRPGLIPLRNIVIRSFAQRRCEGGSLVLTLFGRGGYPS